MTDFSLLMNDASYYEAHVACPRCGGEDIEHTLTGYIIGPDRNSAICHTPGCGWTGIVDQLVPVAPVESADDAATNDLSAPR